MNSFELSQVIDFSGQTDERTDRQREGKQIVPSRVNSGRSLKTETTWVAQKTFKYLTLLHEFEWQYLKACPSVFLSTTNRFAHHVQKKAFQCQYVPMVEFEAILGFLVVPLKFESADSRVFVEHPDPRWPSCTHVLFGVQVNSPR